MAVLSNRDLGFEFRYTGFLYEWVEYHFRFLWKGEPMVRDEVLIDPGQVDEGRRPGSFFANSPDRDELLPLLHRVLATDEADCWAPIERDIVVAIYPDDFFPFFTSPGARAWEALASRNGRPLPEPPRRERGKPTDLYTFIALADGANFRGARGEHGAGLSLQMLVTRAQLEAFAAALEQEYAEFREAVGLDDEHEDPDWTRP